VEKLVPPPPHPPHSTALKINYLNMKDHMLLRCITSGVKKSGAFTAIKALAEMLALLQYFCILME